MLAASGKGEPLVGNVNITRLEKAAGCTDLAKASALDGRLVCCAAAQGSSDRGRPVVMRACGRPLSRCIAFTCVPNPVTRDMRLLLRGVEDVQAVNLGCFTDWLRTQARGCA